MHPYTALQNDRKVQMLYFKYNIESLKMNCKKVGERFGINIKKAG
jgi:hypothetical protein